jgi:hypothetical protein
VLSPDVPGLLIELIAGRFRRHVSRVAANLARPFVKGSTRFITFSHASPPPETTWAADGLANGFGSVFAY